MEQHRIGGSWTRCCPLRSPAHQALLSYVTNPKLSFTPGTDYRYSNSDNIIVALMVEAATQASYEQELNDRVLVPLGLAETSLPNGAALPTPFAHGYDVDPPHQPSDVTSFFAAGWSWSAGGVVSTPQDANTFIRGYVRSATTSATVRAAQFRFRPGTSEPPGPGVNSAGMALFRYQTGCGTVYGHTGNTLGYTAFVAATQNGSDSAVVLVNAQLSPKVDASGFAALQKVYTTAVCASLS